MAARTHLRPARCVLCAGLLALLALLSGACGEGEPPAHGDTQRPQAFGGDAGAAATRSGDPAAAAPEHEEPDVVKSDERWREKLTPEQYRITREAGTERAFTGEYWDHKADGVFRCVCCGVPLFDSEHKFDSGTGWPSFYTLAGGAPVVEHRDESHGMVRTEVRCGRCEAHLGHLFPDGPQPTGLRYCINSAALDFAPRGGAGSDR